MKPLAGLRASDSRAQQQVSQCFLSKLLMTAAQLALASSNEEDELLYRDPEQVAAAGRPLTLLQVPAQEEASKTVLGGVPSAGPNKTNPLVQQVGQAGRQGACVPQYNVEREGERVQHGREHRAPVLEGDAAHVEH